MVLAGALVGAAALAGSVALGLAQRPAEEFVRFATLAFLGIGIVIIGRGIAVAEDHVTGVMVLFAVVLPSLNGLLDWASLSISRWFGRGIVAKRGALALSILFFALDLLTAVAFAFSVAWLLAFGVEISALNSERSFDLELEQYVAAAAASPWTVGLWPTLMVFSTLIPTAVHLALVLGAGIMAWQGNLLRSMAARRLGMGEVRRTI